ncbi:2-hydroxyacid dehydrogenase [Paraburkholderia tropica]|uniref:2-hydroxyacid dehydrogenase n=1 Tax=Paraburkholderia tropica TaxID=92647 RepID=UPI001592A037|nr:2-hydroxyacid dehydrogenase [Paraburkholderia tropica]
MQRETILQIGAFSEQLQQTIDAEFDTVSEDVVNADESLRVGIRAIITRSACQIPAALLDRLPALRVIATSGVGYDGLPVAAAKSRGIVVTNTPGVLDAAVCELSIGLLLSLLRKIPAMDSYVRLGGWKNGPWPMTTGLQGKRVGIVGLGRIGRGIAERLQPFGVKLAYCGRQRQPVPYEYVETIHELAGSVDILILSCPGGPSTESLVDAEVLSRLGSKGFLVNVSRGSVVDESALIHALQKNVIRGAALDVFRHEPLVESPLTALDNVVLSPHSGSATEETRSIMLRLTLDNIHKVLTGEQALSPV